MILKMFLPVNQKISLQQSKKLKKMFPQANFILEQRTNESIENANQNCLKESARLPLRNTMQIIKNILM